MSIGSAAWGCPATGSTLSVTSSRSLARCVAAKKSTRWGWMMVKSCDFDLIAHDWMSNLLGKLPFELVPEMLRSEDASHPLFSPLISNKFRWSWAFTVPGWYLCLLQWSKSAACYRLWRLQGCPCDPSAHGINLVLFIAVLRGGTESVME